MLIKTVLPSISMAVIGIFGLSACSSGSDVGASNGDVEISGTDSTEVTCERFNDINQRFDDIDLQAMEPDALRMRFSDGVADIEAVSNDAENLELAESIATMADAMRSAVGSANGDLDSIHAEFQEQLQGVEVQEAAAHIDEVCDARMNL